MAPLGHLEKYANLARIKKGTVAGNWTNGPIGDGGDACQLALVGVKGAKGVSCQTVMCCVVAGCVVPFPTVAVWRLIAFYAPSFHWANVRPNVNKQG